MRNRPMIRTRPGLPILFAMLLSLGFGCTKNEVGDPYKAPPASGGRRAVIADVQWPTTPPDVVARGSLSSAALEAVERSSVPVLVPHASDLLGAAKVIIFPVGYAFSSTASGITIALSGTRLAYDYGAPPSLTSTTTVRGAPAFVFSNDDVWSTSWSENNVSYVLDVFCEYPSTDARCADDSFLAEVAESLVYVGGAGSEAAQ